MAKKPIVTCKSFSVDYAGKSRPYPIDHRFHEKLADGVRVTLSVRRRKGRKVLLSCIVRMAPMRTCNCGLRGCFSGGGLWAVPVQLDASGFRL